MSIQDLPPDFELLLNQLLNGEDEDFSTLEFERFQNYLLSDPRALQHYFEYLDINSGIQTDMSEQLQTLEKIVDGEPAQPPRETSKTPLGKRASLIHYPLIVTASLLLFLAVEWITSGDFLWKRTADSVSKTNLTNQPYIATLTRSTDCVWGGMSLPEFSGQRLLSDDLVLEQGVAEFRFDSGVRLIIEGPTKIKVKTACCAELDYGKMVLHGYEAAPEFSLVTPLLTFHDIGTEYGAKIDKNGDVDLHVFEGAVRVDPNQKNEQFAESIIIKGGQARHLN
ncbi:MAG: hypothetical protein KDA77_23595, partial [Planctomycetaceae bacterium]|nr:hypothetical protein [Planctomycetaceae bacterium]